MLWILIRKELQTNLLSKRFAFALVIILTLMMGSTSILLKDHEESMLDYQANLTGAREIIKEADWWWRLQWHGIKLVRPVTSSSILVTGTERNPDTLSMVFDRGRPIIRSIGSIDRNPLLAILPAIDLVFIVGIVLSLIVLVLSYDIITAEREQGTLKLLLSFPVPRAYLIFAKWAGGLLTLSLPFLIGILCMAVWIQLSPAIHFTPTDNLIFLGITIASLLYISWLFSACMAVSCVCKRSTTALCTLVCLWVVFVLVIPNITPYLATNWVDVDSQQSVRFRSTKITKELQTEESKGLEEIRKKYGAKWWWRHPQSWQEGLDLVTDINNRQRQATRAIVDERNTQINRQSALALSVGRVSPFSSFMNIATTLAWTGPAYEEHLRHHMRQYEDRIRRIVTDNMKNDGAFEVEKIPYFNYTPPSLSQRFMAAFLDWILLLAGTVIFFLLAFTRFVTQDII